MKTRDPFKCLRIVSAIILGAWFVVTVRAELPVARLFSVFPPGGKSGSTFEVTVAGVDLDGVSELRFSGAGVAAKPKMVPASGKPEPNHFIVTIAPDVTPGVREARVVGRFGISNPRAFAVGDASETISKGGNASAASAMVVPLESTVNGRCDANAVDYFKFAQKKGQRVLIDCLAREIDSRLEPVLTLLDASGHELERSRRGELLDFTAPKDGEFILAVHDFLYRGGDDFFYRISIGTSPHLDFVLPPMGLPGTTGKHVLYGRNLPGGVASEYRIDGKPLEQLPVEIDFPNDPPARHQLTAASLIRPSETALDAFEYRLKGPRGYSNPLALTSANAPVALEREPNDKSEEAQTLAIPGELAGQFYPRGDRDWVAFEARKGDVYWVEIFSQRLNLPTDPFVVIRRVTKNAQGEETLSDVKELYDTDTNIGGPDYNTASRDPAWRFEVKETGTYRIEVRDLFNSRDADPSRVYRLSIRHEAPEFRLAAVIQAPPPANKDKKEYFLWTLFLRRGESIPIKVLAFRRDNFDGEIEISATGLPSGVHVSRTSIGAGQNSAMLTLTADEHAASWAGTFRIVGKARIGESEIAREARAGGVTWNVLDANNEPVRSRLIGDLALSVSGQESAPIVLSAAERKVWETSLAGKLTIPVKVERHGEFNGNIKVKPAGSAVFDSANEVEINGKANEGKIELDLTKTKLPVGLQTFYLVGQTQGKYSRVPPEEAKAIETRAKDAEEAANQAAKSASGLSDAAKRAGESLKSAAQSLDEAEGKVKVAAEKFEAASTAAAKTPVAEELVAAKNAAEKELNDAKARRQRAADSKATAEKTAADASTKAKAAEDKKSIAANEAKEAKDALEKIKPKDTAATFFSAPIELKIAPAPIRLSANGPSTPLEQGAKTEITVTIQRLYDYGDTVELSVEIPRNATGLSVANVTVPKDKSEATLVVQASSNAAVGQHPLKLRAALKWNKQDLKVEQPISIAVIGRKENNP